MREREGGGGGRERGREREREGGGGAATDNGIQRLKPRCRNQELMTTRIGTLRQDPPLEAILVIFGRRALIFFF